MKTILTCLLLILYLINSACDRNFTGIDDSPTPPRQLTWTADTLRYSIYDQTWMYETWASSPTNVYAVGHCSDVDGTMYYFNGKKWENILLSVVKGGPVVGHFGIDAVYGFSSNDVYAVGRRTSPMDQDIYVSLIVHFNGSTWEVVDIPEKERLITIWGAAPNDIWVGGFNGRLFHYDGMYWTTDTLPHAGYPQYSHSLIIRDITGNADKKYLHCYTVRGLESDLHHFFSLENNNWVLMDSLILYHNEIWMSPSGILYKCDQDGLSFWNGNGWDYLFTGPGIFDVSGPNDNNLFLIGQDYDHRVYHYNGHDLYEYENLIFTDGIYTDVNYIEGHVFIVGSTNKFPQQTIILHGR